MTSLPPGWAMTTLGEVAETSLGKMLDRGKSSGNHLVPYLRNVNVQWGQIDTSDVLQMDIPPDERETFRLRAGDLLVCEGGEIGRCAIWQRDGEYMAFQKALHRVRPLRGVSTKYLRYYLEHLHLRGELSRYATGSTIRHIPQNQLRRVELRLPPPAEQHSIVAALDDHLSRLDSASSGVRAAQARFERLEGSRLWQLTHEAGGERTRVLLNEIADIRLGRQRSPKNHHGESMRPYLRAANVDWSGLRLDDVKQMNFTDHEARTYELLVGDIVLSEASGSAREVGKPAVWRGQIQRCCFQNTLIRVRPRSDHSAFLTSYLRAEAKAGRFAARVRGVGIHHLGAAQLSIWPVDLPEYAAQEWIAEAVSSEQAAFDRIRYAIADILDRASGLRQALLSSAFEGRLLPHVPSDEPASVLLERIRRERAALPKTRRGRRTAPVPQEEALL